MKIILLIISLILISPISSIAKNGKLVSKNQRSSFPKIENITDSNGQPVLVERDFPFTMGKHFDVESLLLLSQTSKGNHQKFNKAKQKKWLKNFNRELKPYNVNFENWDNLQEFVNERRISLGETFSLENGSPQINGWGTTNRKQLAPLIRIHRHLPSKDTNKHQVEEYYKIIDKNHDGNYFLNEFPNYEKHLRIVDEHEVPEAQFISLFNEGKLHSEARKKSRGDLFFNSVKSQRLVDEDIHAIFGNRALYSFKNGKYLGKLSKKNFEQFIQSINPRRVGKYGRTLPPKNRKEIRKIGNNVYTKWTYYDSIRSHFLIPRSMEGKKFKTYRYTKIIDPKKQAKRESSLKTKEASAKDITRINGPQIKGIIEIDKVDEINKSLKIEGVMTHPKNLNSADEVQLFASPKKERLTSENIPELKKVDDVHSLEQEYVQTVLKRLDKKIGISNAADMLVTLSEHEVKLFATRRAKELLEQPDVFRNKSKIPEILSQLKKERLTSENISALLSELETIKPGIKDNPYIKSYLEIELKQSITYNEAFFNLKSISLEDAHYLTTDVAKSLSLMQSPKSVISLLQEIDDVYSFKKEYVQTAAKQLNDTMGIQTTIDTLVTLSEHEVKLFATRRAKELLEQPGVRRNKSKIPEILSQLKKKPTVTPQ